MKPSPDSPSEMPSPNGAATRCERDTRGLLARLGLHRPELRAWALYDVANSSVVTTIVAAIFPIYFYRVAGANLAEGVATQRFAVATFVAMAALALVAPLLGVVADRAPVKKKLLGLFLGLGAVAASAMFTIHTGDWLLALVLFATVEFAVASTLIFYDSLLPHIASHDEVDRVSTIGYALGYLGGGLLLGLNLLWITHPQWFGLPSGGGLTESQSTLPTRLAFLSVAVWWVVFSIPLFVKISEPHIANDDGEGRKRHPIPASLSQLRETIGSLVQYRQAGLMLLAFLAYNEGIGTIIKMATIYGAEIGLESGAMIASILIVQFVGIPFTICFGLLAGRLGAKPTIFIGLVVYLGIAALGYALKTNTQFLLLALLVAMVQGGTQALSRSLFASLIPKQKSAQFFALFALSEKLAGMFGPALFVLAITLTGSSRNAIASVVLFFVVGGVLLSFVNVDEGRRASKAASDLEA